MKKGFYFRSMKALITILFSWFWLQGFSQFIKPNNSYGTIMNRVRPDSTLLIPTGCGEPVGIAGLRSVNQRMSAIYFDSCSGKGYVFNPQDTTWAEFGGGTDSTVFQTIYRADTAKNNLRAEIAGKVDSITRSADSVFQWRGGVPFFAFIDSTGGGTDSTAFNTLQKLNDSTAVWQRPNGTADTLVIVADGLIGGRGGDSGITTLANIGTTPNAQGATISGSTLTLQPASASFGGLVTTGAQTFAGEKTIGNILRFNPTENEFHSPIPLRIRLTDSSNTHIGGLHSGTKYLGASPGQQIGFFFPNSSGTNMFRIGTTSGGGANWGSINSDWLNVSQAGFSLQVPFIGNLTISSSSKISNETNSDNAFSTALPLRFQLIDSFNTRFAGIYSGRKYSGANQGQQIAFYFSSAYTTGIQQFRFGSGNQHWSNENIDWLNLRNNRAAFTIPIVLRGGGDEVPSANLISNSTTQGWLPSRLTQAQRDAIASPATALTLYCTDCTANDASTGVMQTFNGSVWKNHW